MLSRPDLPIRKGPRQQLLQLIRRRSRSVTPQRHLQVTIDPGDNIFLECADAARADYLVTGNARLRRAPKRAVNALVIDASIAVKWVVEESGTPEALTLRRRAKLVAPDLLAVECANILWKKVLRHELSKEGALLAARLLQGAEIELVPTRSLLEAAARIAIELDHPAYDCLSRGGYRERLPIRYR